MVYTILITIVFIAEIIIATTIIQNLMRCDKAILDCNETIEKANPIIKEISDLAHKVSEQAVELSEHFVYKFKKDQEDIVLRFLSRVLMLLLLLKINSKAINTFRKSKSGKLIIKGLSMLGNMV